MLMQAQIVRTPEKFPGISSHADLEHAEGSEVRRPEESIADPLFDEPGIQETAKAKSADTTARKRMECLMWIQTTGGLEKFRDAVNHVAAATPVSPHVTRMLHAT